jgi:hypothetical protein
MLAFEQATTEKLLPAPSVSLWLINQVTEAPRLEILAIDSYSAVRAWQLCDLDQASIEQNLRILNPDSLPIHLVGNAEDLETFNGSVQFDCRVVNCLLSNLAKKRASKILARRQDPWIDLRRDALASQDPWRRYRTSITRLVLATSFFFAVVCGTLIWRASHYRSIATQYEQSQQDIFRRTFPGQRVPAAILGRLKSEHAKAKGVRSTDASTAAPESALSILRKIIESLSNEFPFEVKEIRIENNRLAMEIELSSQQDAGKVAAALALQGFRVEPPATTLVDGDRIRASLLGAFDTVGDNLSNNFDSKAFR